MSSCNAAVYPTSWSDADISTLSSLAAVFLLITLTFVVLAIWNTAAVFSKYRRIKAFFNNYPSVTVQDVLRLSSRDNAVNMIDALDSFLLSNNAYNTIANLQKEAVTSIGDYRNTMLAKYEN